MVTQKLTYTFAGKHYETQEEVCGKGTINQYEAIAEGLALKSAEEHGHPSYGRYTNLYLYEDNVLVWSEEIRFINETISAHSGWKVYEQQSTNLQKTTNNKQSRRDFFKNSAKTILPILGMCMLPNGAKAMLKAIEEESTPSSCNNNCSYNCTYGCRTTCNTSCSGSCNILCRSDCEYTCTSTCEGTCKNGCHYSCEGTCKGFCTYSCRGTCSGYCSVSCTGTAALF